MPSVCTAADLLCRLRTPGVRVNPAGEERLPDVLGTIFPALVLQNWVQICFLYYKSVEVYDQTQAFLGRGFGL